MGIHDAQPLLTAGRPLDRDSTAVILLHGRGAGPENILDLLPRLDRPALTYLAPAAAGRTWYPASFLAPRDQNEPWLSSALAVVRSVVDGLVHRGVTRDRVVVMGFSQGACLASEFALRHPARYGGLVAFTGGVIGPPGTTWDDEVRAGRVAFAGMPAFFGCSDADAHVPETRVNETADLFTRLGAEVTTRIYPRMGHLVNDDEVRAARVILDAAVAGTPAGR